MPTWTPASAGAEREATAAQAPDLTPLYPEADAGEVAGPAPSAAATGGAAVRAAAPTEGAGLNQGEGEAGQAQSAARRTGRALGRGLQQLWRHRSGRIGLTLSVSLVLAALLGPWLVPYSPTSRDYLALLQPPSWAHPLGTDYLGRDVLARILYGARISLVVGLVSVGLAVAAGVVIGMVAGYWGGIVDAVAMRAMDVLLAFPGILLAIGIMAALGPSLTNAMIAVGIVSIPVYARLVRGSVLAVRETEYVLAARAVGLSPWRILIRHVLPNALVPLFVQATLGIGTAVLDTAGLGFLGLGAQPPTPEWGTMLADARPYMRTAPWILWAPGVAIAWMVLGFNLLGDGLRDVLDPRGHR